MLASFISRTNKKRKGKLKGSKLNVSFGRFQQNANPPLASPASFESPEIFDITQSTSDLVYNDSTCGSDQQGSSIQGSGSDYASVAARYNGIDSFPKVQLDLSSDPLSDWFPQELLRGSSSSPIQEETRSATNADASNGRKPPRSIQDEPSVFSQEEESFVNLSDKENQALQIERRKQVPTPIKIPIATHSSTLQLQPQTAVVETRSSDAAVPQLDSAPVSRSHSPFSDDMSSISGTTLARALIANSFILSNDVRSSRYRSGLARQDSATLPPGEHPLLSSPFWRDRRVSGSAIVLSPETGQDSPVPPLPPLPSSAGLLFMSSNGHRSVSEISEILEKAYMRDSADLKRNRSTSSARSRRSFDVDMATQPVNTSITYNPPSRHMSRRISRISEVASLSSAPNTPLSKPDSPSSHKSEGALEVLDTPASLPMTSPTSTSESSLRRSNSGPQHCAQSHGDDGLDGYTFHPLTDLGSPGSESSASYVGPASQRLRPDHVKRRNAGKLVGTSLPAADGRTDWNITRGDPDSLRDGKRSLDAVRQSQLLPIGERPRSISVSHVPMTSNNANSNSVRHSIISHLLPIVPADNNQKDSANMSRDVEKTQAFHVDVPLVRPRMGIAPQPITVVRDVDDLSQFNILSPDADFDTSSSSHTPASSSVGYQTFPETPSAFSPLWSPDFARSPPASSRPSEDVESSRDARRASKRTSVPGPNSSRAPPSNWLQQLVLSRSMTVSQRGRDKLAKSLIPPAPHVPFAPYPSASGCIASQTPVSSSDSRNPSLEVTSASESSSVNMRDDSASLSSSLLPAVVIEEPSEVEELSESAVSSTADAISNAPSSEKDASLVIHNLSDASQGESIDAPPTEMVSHSRGLSPSNVINDTSLDTSSTSLPHDDIFFQSAPELQSRFSQSFQSSEDLPESNNGTFPDINRPVTSSTLPESADVLVIAHSAAEQSIISPSPNSPSTLSSPPSTGLSNHAPPSPAYSSSPSLAYSVAPPPPYQSTAQANEDTRPPTATRSSPVPNFNPDTESTTSPNERRTLSNTSSRLRLRPPSGSRTSSGSSTQTPTVRTRTRARPPLPIGPRKPSQGPVFSSSSIFSGLRERNGSISSVSSMHNGGWPSGSTTWRKLYAASSSQPKFQVPPLKWRGLTMDAAQWTFTSRQLQDIVSHAIKQSADASAIRLLRLEALETEIPDEIHRLEMRRMDTKTKYKFLSRKRWGLMRSLAVYIDGTESYDTSSVILIVEELAELQANLDQLADELHSVTEQLSELKNLRDVHSASALSMALRKLNTSFLKQVTEAQILRQQIQVLEAERDEAWKHAEDVAHDFDDLNERLRDSAGRISSGSDTKPTSSGRSSRILAKRKSSVRVSKAGLRPASLRRSQRFSVSSSAYRGSMTGPLSSARSTFSHDDVPPVPAMPHSSLSVTVADGRHSGVSSIMTSSTDARALMEAQQELYDMLGISVQDGPSSAAIRRSRSVSGLLSPKIITTDEQPTSVQSPTAHHRSRPSSWHGVKAAQPCDAIHDDRQVLLATLGMISN